MNGRGDVVYLEATCGHEYAHDLANGAAPTSVECPDHGRVGLWAQRLEPKTASPRQLVVVPR